MKMSWFRDKLCVYFSDALIVKLTKNPTKTGCSRSKKNFGCSKNNFKKKRTFGTYFGYLSTLTKQTSLRKLSLMAFMPDWSSKKHNFHFF